jgi:hypothetical protein
MQNAHHERIGDAPILPVDAALLQSPFGAQAVLYVEVHADDAALLSAEDADWIRVLREFDWQFYRTVAALYYQALWEFNADAARRRREARLESADDATREQADLWSVEEEEGDDADDSGELETREDATLRLMRERPTGGNEQASILHPTPLPPQTTPTVRPELLEPGVVPFRIAGKAPKCFFALLKAFLGVQAMGRSATADEVDHHLRISPPYARASGFTQPKPDGKYRQSDIPSHRKLQQFEQIMAARGLWASVRVQTIRDNINQGVIDLESQVLAQDTTHYVAFSAMDVIETPQETCPPVNEALSAPAAESRPTEGKKPLRVSKSAKRGTRRAAREKCRKAWRERYEEKKAKRRGSASKTKASPHNPRKQAAASSGASQPTSSTSEKRKRKSQSRTIKNCRCVEPETCKHPWTLSDAGAGTVVKGGRVGGKRKYWAHKAAVLSTAPGGIPLDAIAMADAASHDGTALLPQMRSVFATYPELKEKFKVILADTAMDDADTKQSVRDEFGMDLKTPTNPRAIKTITTDLGRGMKSLSPTGVLTCQADRELPFKGVRFEEEKFIYDSPRLSTGEVACLSCPLRDACCRRDTKGGREVEIPITRLPHIDPGDPPMARRFKALMRNRTSVERAIKKLKLDFGDDHLTRRGNDAFQAHLDRSLIALHLLLRLTKR